jgi:hypothetical protein
MDSGRNHTGMSSLIKKDEEICRGCLCIIRSKELEKQLNVLCHGNPFILTADENISQLVCPCSNCLIKRMCKDVCEKYTCYAGLTIGEG